MNRLCQVVLVFLTPVGLSVGCYDMHGRGADAGTDSGRTIPAVDASVRTDVGGREDAPEGVDAPGACPLARPDATCLESFALPAGMPIELPFQYDTCGCCIETSCAVAVDSGSRTLRLTTGLCPDPCDCDACVTPRGTCAVPPLPLDALGQWTVEVNGVVAYAIGVVETSDPTFVPPPPGCATYAEIDECGGAVPDLTTGPVRAELCVDVAEHSDRTTLRMRSACWGCGVLDSECRAIIQPRLERDGPPGGDITLHARDYVTSCDVDCPAVCEGHVRECDLPPLELGQLYRVFVDGEQVTAFTYGEPSMPCPIL